MSRPILFIAPTRIGDAVLSTSVLRQAMAEFPESAVHIVTSSLSAPLFEAVPRLEALHGIDKQRYSLHWLRILRLTITTRYACVIDLRGSATPYLLRTGKRMIFRGSDEAISKHRQFATFMGTDNLPYPTLWPRPTDTAFAEAACGSGPLLAFAPIANWPPKEWPLERFITLAKTLLKQTAGARPLLICAAHEQPRIQPMIEALSACNPITLCDGSAPLLSVYACLQRANLFVGNDSGLMHMAAAAGIPTFGVFGPTPADIYQPIGAKAHVIRAKNGDLSQLSVESVLAEMAAAL